ncbi:Lsr2 dimerization domain-containing protein [Amycolatopsis sp. NPDC003861]
MAEITQTLVVDDFDGEQPADETILWVFEDEALRSDLTSENAAAFREAIQPFLAVARSLGKQKVVGRRRAKRAARAVSAAASVRTRTPNAESFNPHWYRSIRNGPSKIEAAKKRYRDMAREWGEANGFELGFRVSQEVFDAYEQHRIAQGLPVGPAAVGLE